MRISTIVRIALAGTMFVVLLVIATGLLLLDSRWGTERVRRLVVARANTTLNGTLSVQSLSGSLIGGNVRLVGVTLAQNGVDVFRAAEIQLRYDLPQMMSGVSIAEVIVTRPQLIIVQDPRTGVWNVAALTRGGGGGGRPAFAIDRLQVLNGDVEIRPKDAGVQRVAALDALVGLRSTRDRFDVDVRALTARDANTGMLIRQLTGGLAIGQGRIEMTDLRLATDGSAVSGRVASRTRHDAATDAAIRSFEFDLVTRPLLLRDVAVYVPAVAGYPASAIADVDATGTLDAFSATWKMSSDAGRGTGALTGRSEAGVLMLAGDVNAKELDAREWFHNDMLPERVDVKGTYQVYLPRGRPEPIRVTFESTIPHATIAQYTLDDIRASGTYTNGTVEGRGSARAYGAAITGSGRWNKDSRVYAGEGTFVNLNLKTLPAHVRAPDLESDLDGRARFEGSPARWLVDAVLGPSTVEGADLADGFVASAEGRAGDVGYRGTGRVRHLNPQRFVHLAENPPDVLRRAVGDLNADVAFEGRGTTVATMSAWADVRFDDSVLPGLRLDDTRLRATLIGGALAADLDATTVEVIDDPLGYKTGVLDAAGSAVMHVELPDITRNVRLEDVGARGTLAVTRFSARGVGLDRGDIAWSMSGGTLSLSTFVVEGSDINVSATGSVALAGSGASDLTFVASLGDLSMLEPFTGQAMAGGASAEGRVTGPADRPRIAGTVKGRELDVSSMSALSFTGTFDATLPGFDVERAVGSLAASATFVEVSNTPLDEVLAKAVFDSGRVELDATLAQGAREFDVGGVLVPHPDHREVHMTRITFTAGETTWRLREGQEAVVQYAPRRVTVTGLSLVNGTATLDVSGALGDGAVEPLVVVARGVAVEDLNQMALGTRNLAGRIDADLAISGAMDSPVVTGTATVADGQVEGLPFQTLTATGGYRDRRVTLDAALDAGPLGQVTVVGSLPYVRNAPAGATLASYDLTITSTRLDVGFFQPLTSYVENLRGTGLVNIRLTGPANAPSFDGTVSLAAVTFAVPATGMTYSDLNADLSLAGQQLTVNRFRLVDDDGHAATIEGSLSVPGIAEVNSFEMLIATDNFHLLDNELGEVAVTSSLQALGDLATPLVSGTITVNRGRIEVSDLLDRFASTGYRTTPVPLPGATATTAAVTPSSAALTTPTDAAATPSPAATRPAAPAAAQAQPSSYTRSSLSITLDMPGNVVVRGRDLRTGSGPIGFGDINVTIGGALSIAKESGEEAVLLGRVDVVRGQYQFQGRQFAIVRGSELRFQGSPTNPALDVTAERAISGVTAEVRVAGTLSRPEINLSSNPPLEEGDILSLIVFNQPMNELPGSERISLAARAGAMAAGAIATPLADSVARALDLDLFEIRPSELAGGGASVRVGRQVSDRLFLGFAQDFGREEVSQISFEYRLNELISIVTSIAHGSGADYSRRRAEQAGIDLIFMVR